MLYLKVNVESPMIVEENVCQTKRNSLNIGKAFLKRKQAARRELNYAYLTHIFVRLC